MDWETVVQEAQEVIGKEPRFIQLPREGKVVFVGDTHGDLNASEEVLRNYLVEPYRIVFLGDYVDRGEESGENLLFLLEAKLQHPDRFFLLAGNHEGYMVKEFYPANFWESLSRKEQELFGLLFSKFPLAVASENGLLGLHGGLPDLMSIEEIDTVEWGGPKWDQIVWGDFVEKEGDFLGDWGGRPQYGRGYFDRMMKRYQKTVLIRSHQPYAPPRMFANRCITILTSSAYLPLRTIAVADLEKEIRNGEDVVLTRI